MKKETISKQRQNIQVQSLRRVVYTSKESKNHLREHPSTGVKRYNPRSIATSPTQSKTPSELQTKLDINDSSDIRRHKVDEGLQALKGESDNREQKVDEGLQVLKGESDNRQKVAEGVQDLKTERDKRAQKLDLKGKSYNIGRKVDEGVKRYDPRSIAAIPTRPKKNY